MRDSKKHLQSNQNMAVKNPNLEFVYPVHLNPNVQIPVTTLLANQHNIHLIEPNVFQKVVNLNGYDRKT